MHAFLMSLTLFGQAEAPIPGAPAPVPSAGPVERIDDLKIWLLTRLIVDMSFDSKKSAEVERLINTMNERQLRELIAVYKERTGPRQPPTKSQQENEQQQAEVRAKMNLQQAQAWRDDLKHQYDFRLLQTQMAQSLVTQNILLNNQRMMSLYNGPSVYGPFASGAVGYGQLGYGNIGYGNICYGGIGYGAVNYGGFSYGAPGTGGPVIYAGW
jgi:hypothetical protein